jgi:hypothetical protein
MKVWASLFTGSTQSNNTTTETFIGSDKVGTNATILLTKSYSYLEAKYDPTTEICDLKIYGGAKTQPMTLSVKVSILTITVSTKDCFFPLTYHYNITLCKSDLTDENGNLLQGADEIAIFDMGQRFKLMTGANLTIEEGVKATFDTLIVYETFVDEGTYGAVHYRYPNLPAAVLTVNGELVCNTFGGKIYSNNEGAKVTINVATSCTSNEIKSILADSFSSKVTEFNTIVEEAELVNADATSVTELTTPLEYQYKDGKWAPAAVLYSITKTTESNATVTVPGSAKAGDVVTVTVSFSGTKDFSLIVKDSAGNELLNKNAAGTYTFVMPEGNVTVEASSGKESSSCITAGTLITLADGTQKKVEDLTMDDVLLVFNHETGEYEAAGIIFIENDGWKEYNVITLTFSDGTTTKLIYEHAYFDLTLGKYVYITEQNYTDFIGHEFAMQSEDGFKCVTMTDATLAVEYTGCYSLVTVYHLNYFVDGLFSIPGGITGLFNMFEYGDDLVYDQEKMQADIEEYGLFTYEDFEEFLPYEFYQAFPAAYLKVSIGKGLMTFDDIYAYIDQFLVKNGLM